MKKFLSPALVLILVLALFGCGKQPAGQTIVSSLFADRITDKFSDGGYFVVVALDDSVVESYQLSGKELTFPLEKELYDKLEGDEELAGITIRATLPKDCPETDIGLLLHEGRAEYCTVLSFHTIQNTTIQ